MRCHRLWTISVGFAFFYPLAVSAQLLDGIAAIVNTNIITFSAVREMVLPVERELRRTYAGQELQEKLKASALDALNTLVERSLIVQEFKSKEFKIPRSEEHTSELQSPYVI